MESPFLTGNRVYLRPLDRSDAPRLTTWFNDPSVRHHLLTYRPKSLAQEEERIANSTRNEREVLLGIARREPDGLVGCTGLHEIDPKNRTATFGIAIGERSEWGRGYGSEATRLIVGYGFDTLNLNRIELQVYEDNLRAIRAYERIGFQREGMKRQALYRGGRYWHVLLMSLLKDEWDAAQQAHRGAAV